MLSVVPLNVNFDCLLNICEESAFI